MGGFGVLTFLGFFGISLFLVLHPLHTGVYLRHKEEQKTKGPVMTKIHTHKKIVKVAGIAASIAAFAVGTFVPDLADVAQVFAESLCHLGEES